MAAFDAIRTRLLGGRFQQEVFWNMVGLAVLAVSWTLVQTLIGALRGDVALGIFSLVYSIYVISSQVAVFGIHASVLKHVSYNQDDLDTCAEITVGALVLTVLLSGMVCGALLMGQGWMARWLSVEEARAFAMAVPGLFFFSLNKSLLFVLNGLRHMRAYAVFSALRFVLILGVVSALLVLDAADSTLPLAFSLAELTLFVLAMADINLRLFRTTRFNRLGYWMKEHLSFGMRGVLSGMLTDLNTESSKLLVRAFLSEAALGHFSLAATLAAGFLQFPSVVARVVNPIMGKSFSENKSYEIERLGHRLRKIFVPVFVVTAAAAVLLWPVFLMLFKPEFDASWAPFALLMVGIVVYSIQAPFQGILYQGGNPGMHSLMIGLVLIINVALALCLIPAFGLIGAALASMGAFIVNAAALALFADRLYGVRLWGKPRPAPEAEGAA